MGPISSTTLPSFRPVTRTRSICGSIDYSMGESELRENLPVAQRYIGPDLHIVIQALSLRGRQDHVELVRCARAACPRSWPDFVDLRRQSRLEKADHHLFERLVAKADSRFRIGIIQVLIGVVECKKQSNRVKPRVA